MLICDPRFGLSQISWRRHHPTEDNGWPRLATACQPTETGTPGPASGQGKRARSNPGTAPQADSTDPPFARLLIIRVTSMRHA